MARDVTDTTVTAPAIGDPAPLGLAGFALTTMLLSGVNSGRITTGGLAFVGMALFYGGAGQFAAGMWEYRNGNTFGATAFSSYGAFWMGVGIMVVFEVFGHPMLTGDGAIWFFFSWGLFTTYMWVASFRVSGAVMAVFLLLAITFWLLWLGALNGDVAGKGMTKLGGYLGIITALVAWYTSFAGVANSTFARTILPVFPLGRTVIDNP